MVSSEESPVVENANVTQNEEVRVKDTEDVPSTSPDTSSPETAREKRKRQQLKYLEIMEFKHKRLMKPKVGGVGDTNASKCKQQASAGCVGKMGA